MEIKILGGGCPRCERLEKVTREVVEELGAEATFGHVKEMAEIMEYDVTSTPALVIDGEVKVSGRIPPKADIEDWVRAAQA